MAVEWRRKRERRRHFKEKMSLEEAHHHRRPWIRAWRKKEMNKSVIGARRVQIHERSVSILGSQFVFQHREKSKINIFEVTTS